MTVKADKYRFESKPEWFLETKGQDIFSKKNIGASKIEKNISWHPSNSFGPDLVPHETSFKLAME